jgi:hypothetical protein
MKKVLLFSVLSFIGFNTMAQFPGAGMGMGEDSVSSHNNRRFREQLRLHPKGLPRLWVL